MLLRLFLALVLVWSSCVVDAQERIHDGAHEPSASASISAESKSRLAALIPAGEKATAGPSYYSADTLYLYMDGAADVFQNFDVQVLLHHDVTVGAVDLAIDIFDMGTPDNAFGMYAAERSPTYDFVSIGAEGYRNDGILNFFEDRYYVKLAGFGDGADAVIRVYATDIAGRIGGEARFPALLAQLPDTHRARRTERFFLKDPLGHSFLAPAYQASYELEGGTRELLVSVASTAAEAATRVQRLADHFRSSGDWTSAPEFGAGAFRATNRYEGTIVVAVAGPHVVILLKPSSTDAAFFKDAVARLS